MPIVEIDGDTHEVPLDAIQPTDEEDLVIQTQEAYDSAVQTRLERAKRSVKKDLKEDDAFFQEAAQARGIELREDGQPKGAVKDDELKALRQKASKAETMEEQLTKLESERDAMRRTQLHNTVLSSLEHTEDGAQEDILTLVERNATYDDDYGWVITDSNGNLRYEAGEPLTPDRYASEMLPDQKPYLFKSTEMQGGPKDSPGGSGGGKKTWTREEYEAASRRAHRMSEEEYADWEAAPDEGRVED